MPIDTRLCFPQCHAINTIRSTSSSPRLLALPSGEGALIDLTRSHSGARGTLSCLSIELLAYSTCTVLGTAARPPFSPYVAKRFVADTGVPRSFWTDNGLEYTNRIFVEYWDGLGIRSELTALYTPQQNGPPESALARIFKASLGACIEIIKLFSDVHLERVNDV